MSTVLVRPLVGADRAAWEALWHGYLAFYGTDLDAETTDVVFQRLTDPGYPALWGLVAEVDGQVLGFAHAQTHPSTWSADDDCYLEDLFVDPTSRRHGIGRALIEHLVELGREAGWRQVHWLTDGDNDGARELYDELAELRGQVRDARVID